MPTQYLILNGKQAAKAQNADWWVKVLGRPKHAQDVTEFLFMIVDHPANDTALVYVTEPELTALWPTLSQAEKNSFNNNVKQENDPAVIQFKADVAAAQPPLLMAENVAHLL